jgi:hypothetical protein
MDWTSAVSIVAKFPWFASVALAAVVAYYAMVKVPVLESRLEAERSILYAKMQELKLATAALDAYRQAQEFLDNVRVEQAAASAPYTDPGASYQEKIELLQTFGGGILKKAARNGMEVLIIERSATVERLRPAGPDDGPGVSGVPGGGAAAP